MLCLGIEGTAHTFGAGVVRSTEDGEYSILSNVTDMFRPREGGIHPREAADHHVEVSDVVVRKALKGAGVTPDDIDLVAFSRGPGLGPCLRVAATAARTLALGLGVPIVGVNHCVAHLELGSLLGATDPVLLYASGANTQVITFIAGRYRVLGETLDIGVGNMLDKFGRNASIPFPAGPGIEEMAWEGSNFIELPYSVKGMDLSFSGINTAAMNQLDKDGADIRDLSMSLQETVFAMLTEVTERAMAHTGKTEVLLGGGVACNQRLRGMVSTMARERGARFFVPDRALCVDNGAMIALLGAKMHLAGIRHSLEDTAIDQRFRTDGVDVTWRGEPPPTPPVKGPEGYGDFDSGAEASISLAHIDTLSLDVVEKSRSPKSYRYPPLDRTLRVRRGRNEARLLQAAREAGVPTPGLIDLDEGSGTLTMEYIEGPRLRDVLNSDTTPEQKERALMVLGRNIGRLHASGISHGDLTTSNVICRNSDPEDQVMLDLSMGTYPASTEQFGVDIRLLGEAMASTHPTLMDHFHVIMQAYGQGGGDAETVMKKADEIDARGRYNRQE